MSSFGEFVKRFSDKKIDVLGSPTLFIFDDLFIRVSHNTGSDI